MFAKLRQKTIDEKASPAKAGSPSVSPGVAPIPDYLLCGEPRTQLKLSAEQNYLKGIASYIAEACCFEVDIGK